MRNAAAMQRAGAEYTRFVQFGYQAQIVNLFHDTGELSIPIPALPRPTLDELRSKFPWIKVKGGIKRDDSATEAGVLRLGSVLIPDEEKGLDGAKYERRLLVPRSQGLLFGYQQATWVVEHQQEFPELMQLLGKIHINSPGLIVVDENNYRRAPFLSDDGKRWHLCLDYFPVAVSSHTRAAFSGK